MLYQVFCQTDYDYFKKQYITNNYSWALEDFGKFGYDKAISERINAKPSVESLRYDSCSLLCELRFKGSANELYGAPERVALLWRFLPDEIHLDARWFNKPASRVGEAVWLGIHPAGDVAAVRKISEWIDPADVAVKGNRRLHAVDYGVRFIGGCEIETLDSALVNIGAPDVLSFSTDTPPLDEGVFFNLQNNIFGTNFVMWYDEDARFRFIVRLKN